MDVKVNVASVVPSLEAPHTVTRIAVFDNNVYVGTRTGIIYHWEYEEGFDHKPTLKGKRFVAVEIEAAQERAAIEYLAVLPSVEIVVTMCDGTMVLLGLAGLYVLHKLRGDMTISHICARPSSYEYPAALAVVWDQRWSMRTRVSLYSVKKKNVYLTKVIEVHEAPLSIVWVRSTLFLGFRDQYIAINSQTAQLNHVARSFGKPCFAYVPGGEWLCCVRAKGVEKGMFFDDDIKNTRKPLTWMGRPRDLAIQYPFCVALIKDDIQIHDVAASTSLLTIRLAASSLCSFAQRVVLVAPLSALLLTVSSNAQLGSDSDEVDELTEPVDVLKFIERALSRPGHWLYQVGLSWARIFTRRRVAVLEHLQAAQPSNAQADSGENVMQELAHSLGSLSSLNSSASAAESVRSPRSQGAGGGSGGVGGSVGLRFRLASFPDDSLPIIQSLLRRATEDVFDFLDGFQYCVLRTYKRAEFLDPDALRDVIDEQLFPLVFPIVRQLFCLANEERDANLRGKFERLVLLKIKLEHLGVPRKLCLIESRRPYGPAIDCFRNVETATSPPAILHCVEQTIQQIVSCVTAALSQGESSLGADDLLPIFIYVVVQSQVSHLHALLEVINNWTERRGLVFGQLGYCLATLQTSVNFVDSTPIDQIRSAMRNTIEVPLFSTSRHRVDAAASSSDAAGEGTHRRFTLWKELELPPIEELVAEYSCANEWYVRGRLFILSHYLCFDSKPMLFGTAYRVAVPLSNISKVSKSKFALFDNSLELQTFTDKTYRFVNFFSRDSAYADLLFQMHLNGIDLVPLPELDTDEMQHLAQEIVNGGVRPRHHHWKLTAYPSSFFGRDVVDFLVGRLSVGRDAALVIANDLLLQGHFVPFDRTVLRMHDSRADYFHFNHVHPVVDIAPLSDVSDDDNNEAQMYPELAAAVEERLADNVEQSLSRANDVAEIRSLSPSSSVAHAVSRAAQLLSSGRWRFSSRDAQQ